LEEKVRSIEDFLVNSCYVVDWSTSLTNANDETACKYSGSGTVSISKTELLGMMKFAINLDDEE